MMAVSASAYAAEDANRIDFPELTEVYSLLDRAVFARCPHVIERTMMGILPIYLLSEKGNLQEVSIIIRVYPGYEDEDTLITVTQNLPPTHISGCRQLRAAFSYVGVLDTAFYAQCADAVRKGGGYIHHHDKKEYVGVEYRDEWVHRVKNLLVDIGKVANRCLGSK